MWGKNSNAVLAATPNAKVQLHLAKDQIRMQLG